MRTPAHQNRNVIQVRTWMGVFLLAKVGGRVFGVLRKTGWVWFVEVAIGGGAEKSKFCFKNLLNTLTLPSFHY